MLRFHCKTNTKQRYVLSVITEAKSRYPVALDGPSSASGKRRKNDLLLNRLRHWPQRRLKEEKRVERGRLTMAANQNIR